MSFAVLILDDDVVFASDLRQALATDGCEITFLRDAIAGFDLVKRQHFALIVLSAELHGTNGFRLCNKIRKQPLCKSTKVFLTSQDSSFAVFHRHMKLAGRADGYFLKRTMLGELVTHARTLIIGTKHPPDKVRNAIAVVADLDGEGDVLEVEPDELIPAADGKADVQAARSAARPSTPSALHAQIQSLTQDLAKSRGEVRELKRAQTTSEKSSKDVAQRLSNAQADLASARGEKDKALADAELARKRLRDALAESTRLRRDLEAASKKPAKSSGRTSSLPDTLADDALEVRTQALKTEHADAIARLTSEKDEERARLQQERAAACELVRSQWEARFAQERTEGQKQLDEVQASLAARDAQLAEQANAVAGLLEQLNALRSGKAAEVDQGWDDAPTQHGTTEPDSSTLKALQDDLVASKSELAQATSGLGSLQAQLATLTAEHATEIERYRSEVVELKSDVARGRQESDQRLEKLKTSHASMLAWRDDYNKRILTELRTEHQAATKALQTAVSEANAAVEGRVRAAVSEASAAALKANAAQREQHAKELKAREEAHAQQLADLQAGYHATIKALQASGAAPLFDNNVARWDEEEPCTSVTVEFSGYDRDGVVPAESEQTLSSSTQAVQPDKHVGQELERAQQRVRDAYEAKIAELEAKHADDLRSATLDREKIQSLQSSLQMRAEREVVSIGLERDSVIADLHLLHKREISEIKRQYRGLLSDWIAEENQPALGDRSSPTAAPNGSRLGVDTRDWKQTEARALDVLESAVQRAREKRIGARLSQLDHDQEIAEVVAAELHGLFDARESTIANLSFELDQTRSQLAKREAQLASLRSQVPHSQDKPKGG